MSSKIIQDPLLKFIPKDVLEDYTTCLEAFWSEDKKVSQKIFEMIQKYVHQVLFTLPFYRMWIEILVKENDSNSMAELLEHLKHLSFEQKNPTLKQNLMGLWGILLIEQDHMDGCHLLHNALKNVREPYCLEFNQLFENRRKDKPAVILKSGEFPIWDYFQLELLAKNETIQENPAGLKNILNYVSENFPTSPTENLYAMHYFLDQEDITSALSYSKKLVEAYPLNSDFSFHHGYLQLCCRNIKEAIKIFSKLSKTSNDKDPDVVSLLAYAHYLQSQGDIYSSHWEKAKDFFIKAELNLIDANLPTKEIVSNIHQIKEKEELQNPNFIRNAKIDYYFLNLSPRRYFDVLDAEEEYLETLYQKTPSLTCVGDIFFLGSSSSIETKILAIYEVISSRVFDPLEGYQSAIKLVKKFDRSIKLQTKNLSLKPLSEDGLLQIKDSKVHHILLEIQNTIEEVPDESIANRSHTLFQLLQKKAS